MNGASIDRKAERAVAPASKALAVEGRGSYEVIHDRDQIRFQ
jgi:hypothetical protein